MAEPVSKKTILLVEDEAIIAMAETQLLRKFGYNVITAGHAREAINAANCEDIDLVLMDIDLGSGEMDGTEAAEVILKDHDIPVVFCTSHSEKEYVDKVKGITRYGYVLKNSGEFVLRQSIDMAFELFGAHCNLRQANDTWSSTFNSITDIVTIISKDHKILQINDTGCTTLGAPREEIIGKNCYELVHGTDSPISACPCSEALETSKPGFSEYEENGMIFDLSAWPIYGENEKEIHSFVHIVKDITERESARMREREAKIKSKTYETRYRMLFSSIRDALLVTDTDRNIIDCNPAFTDQFGYELTELQGKKTITVYADEKEYDGMGQALKEHKGDLSDFLYTVHYRKKDGTVFPGETNVFYLHDDEGNIIGFIGLIRDISKRIQREEQLTASEQKYKLLAEGTDAVLWEYDILSDKWTYVAPQVEQILGYKPEEWTNYRFWLDRIHPEDRTWADTYCGECTTRGESHKLDYRFRAKNGSYVWLRDVVNVELGQEGPAKLRGFMIDVTERKEAEEKVNNLLREKEIILQETHHRIKNNMSVITGMLTLEAENHSETSCEKVLNDAAGRVRSMMVLYDKLYRSENRQELRVDLYLPELIREIIDQFSTRHTVTTDLRLEKIVLGADVLPNIGIIINELISNSMKHAFTGISKPCITITVCSEGGGIKLSYSDNGTGLPEEISLENTPNFGLQLIAVLVEQLDGTVEISREGGTTFSIFFGV